MKKIKLTGLQHRVYSALENGEWANAYDLGVGLNTLRALERKGYLVSKHRTGSIFFPRTSIVFKRVDIKK